MGQAAGTRRRGLDSLTVRILLGLGFVLAVVASLFVVLADEVRWLRLAVLLALWAALLAAFALARYRREARAAESRQEEMTRIYELELHREISARREYEVQLAETTRAELESRHDTELAALREQVERLTSVLTGFLDGDLLVERLTLSAEATRIRSVGDAGSTQAIGSVTRQLREGAVSQSGASGPRAVWGPQPPPVQGPLPAAPSGADRPAVGDGFGDRLLDASASAVTEQIPRIVESAVPTPVIDAVPAAPRVVGDPHPEPVEPSETSAELPAAPLEPLDEPLVLRDEPLELRDEPGGTPDTPAAPADQPGLAADDETADLVEIERGATEPEPDVDGDAAASTDAVIEPDPRESPRSVQTGPAGEAARSADSTAPEFRPATDVPDAPARGDSPATAWTLRHRLDTPAAPPVERTPGSRRAARAAAPFAEDRPSEAVAEITGAGTAARDPAGHSSGVSVAELLAAYGSSVPPRRRRHSDDA